MVELSLKVGNEEADSLETALMIGNLSNLIMWIFFIIVTCVVNKYIKKKNAPDQGKHS